MKLKSIAGAALSLAVAGVLVAAPAAFADDTEVASSPDIAASAPTETSPSSSTDETVSSDSPEVTESTTPVVESAPAESSEKSSPATEQKVSPAAVQPSATTYIVALWSYDKEGVKFPQTLVTSSVTTSTDVHALDASATKCGTTYQSDLYISDKVTKELIKSGHLSGAGESWPGGSYRSEFSNTFTTAPCAVPPVICAVTGGSYVESDDHAPADTLAGKSFVSQGDHTAVGFGYPVTGNLQGINAISYSTQNVVGNGIFFRFVVDLSADGGSTYNSLSITTNPIGQASVADVGSKNVFLGKTVAQIAALYPHNKITSIHWQTGSSYAAGDGALLTGYAGDCGQASYVTPPTAVTFPEGSQTCDTYTLPILNENEKYTLNGETRPVAGTFPLTGTVTVVAHTLASANVIQGSHTYTFKAYACPVVVVPPVDPPVVVPPVVDTPVVQAVPVAQLSEGLAYTGADATVPLTIGASALLAGLLLIGFAIVRRRKQV